MTEHLKDAELTKLELERCDALAKELICDNKPMTLRISTPTGTVAQVPTPLVDLI